MSGWLIALCGAFGLLVSLSMDISVTSYSAASILDAGGSSDIINFGLLFKKGVAVACSLAAIAGGLFCIGVGAILSAMHSRD